MSEWLLIVTIVSLPLQFALNAGTNVDLVTTRVLVPLIFILWVARSLARKKIWIPQRAESGLWLALLFFSALSLILGLGWERGARKALYLFSLTPLFFVVADIARSEKWRKRILGAIVASGALAAIAALLEFSLQFILGLEKTLAIWQSLARFFLGVSLGELVTANPSWLVNISGRTILRAFGFFPDPHVFSFFVSLCFFCALGYLFWEKRKVWRIAAKIAAVLMLSSALLSFSRGAYLGLIVGGLFFLVVYLKRAGNLKKFLLAFAGLAIITAVIFFGPIKSRLATAVDMREGSNAERIKNWQQATEIIAARPLTGVGLGNYAFVIEPLAPERNSIYAHNLYLDLAAETGIVGGLLFFLIILAAYLRNLLSGETLGLGLAAALLYFFVHGIFDTPLWSPQVFVLLLVITALGLYSKKNNSRPLKDEKSG